MNMAIKLEEVIENGIPCGEGSVALFYDSESPESVEVCCLQDTGIHSTVRVHLGMLANAVAAMPQE